MWSPWWTLWGLLWWTLRDHLPGLVGTTIRDMGTPLLSPRRPLYWMKHCFFSWSSALLPLHHPGKGRAQIQGLPLGPAYLNDSWSRQFFPVIYSALGLYFFSILDHFSLIVFHHNLTLSRHLLVHLWSHQMPPHCVYISNLIISILKR